MTHYDRTLYEDALNLSVNKSLDDVTTLLQWARNEGRPSAKAEYVEQAIRLLEQVRLNYEQMRNTL
ncbi:MAG TPA: hypothetical protein VNZ52_07350 [Candidatus Thermoplasmatota archaeon]|nr:hypothetical protein [Candidatus Thermoplasmatota archaeon]